MGQAASVIDDGRVRRGQVSDVTVVARVLTADSARIGADGSTAEDDSDDQETTGAALRMVLTHAVLEHGRLWVWERDGQVEAASVSLPPEMKGFRADVGLALARELSAATSDIPPQSPEDIAVWIEATLADVVDTVARRSPAQVLLATGVSAEVTGDARHERRAAVVRPLVDELRGTDESAIAVEIDRVKIAGLIRAGFHELFVTRLQDSHDVWVGTAPSSPSAPH